MSQVLAVPCDRPEWVWEGISAPGKLLLSATRRVCQGLVLAVAGLAVILAVTSLVVAAETLRTEPPRRTSPIDITHLAPDAVRQLQQNLASAGALRLTRSRAGH